MTPEIKSARLQRYTVPVDEQGEWESARLWQHVGQAIVKEDQVAATEEKTKLEVAQRQSRDERKESGVEWVTKYFEHEGIQFNIDGTPSEVPKYTYKHADVRPWDTRNDLQQYENNYVICTKTRHKTPMIRTQSIVSVLDGEKVSHLNFKFGSISFLLYSHPTKGYPASHDGGRPVTLRIKNSARRTVILAMLEQHLQ